MKTDSSPTAHDHEYQEVGDTFIVLELELQQVHQDWDDEEELHLARNIPTPVKAALIGLHISRELIDGHGEHAPPVVLAIAEAHLVGVPPGASVQVGSNEPPNQEDEIVDWSQAHEAMEVYSQEITRRHRAWMPLLVFEVIHNFDIGKECTEHEEFVEAKVGRVNQSVCKSQEILL